MKVREATASDIDSIVHFQLEMASETENIVLDEATVKTGVSAVLADVSKGRYYVAEINGEVVSSLLTTYEWSDWRNGTVLWIQSVYVIPGSRRKGVYRSMYAHIKKLVSENGDFNGIRLYADKNNLPAQKTYKNLGMSADHYVTFEWLK